MTFDFNPCCKTPLQRGVILIGFADQGLCLFFIGWNFYLIYVMCEVHASHSNVFSNAHLMILGTIVLALIRRVIGIWFGCKLVRGADVKDSKECWCCFVVMFGLFIGGCVEIALGTGKLELDVGLKIVYICSILEKIWNVYELIVVFIFCVELKSPKHKGRSETETIGQDHGDGLHANETATGSSYFVGTIPGSPVQDHHLLIASHVTNQGDTHLNHVEKV